MTVLLWNTGERQGSGPWSPRRIPLFFFNPPLQRVAQICSVIRAGELHPVLPFSLLLNADLKTYHPGTKIESRRRSHTCVNFLRHEAQDLAFWDVWDLLWTLARVFGLAEQNYSGLGVRMHFRLTGNG